MKRNTDVTARNLNVKFFNTPLKAQRALLKFVRSSISARLSSIVEKKKLWGSATDARAVGESGSGAAPEAATAELADEVRRLRKELAKAHRREEILKKAALILGNDPHDDMSSSTT